MPRSGEAAPARTPRWQRLDAEARRAQILDCARRLFTERAYASVSMAEIARCAGVQRGLLHHHFGDKHDLYVAVVRDLLAQFGSIIDGSTGTAGAAERDMDLDEVVATYVDRWLGLVERHADSWFALLDADPADRDPEVAGVVRRAQGAMVDGIVTALGLGEVGPEVRAVLRSYGGAAAVATREWLRRGSLDRPQVQALLATTLVAMVRDVTPSVEAAGPPPGAPEAR